MILRRKIPERIVIVDRDEFKTTFDSWEDDEDDNGDELSEIGMRYYVTRVLDDLDVYRMINNEDVERSIQYYEQMLTKYGNDLHRVYFGNVVDEKIHKQILEDFDKTHTKGILPQGYDAHFAGSGFSESPEFENARGVALYPDLVIVIKNPVNIFDELHGDVKQRLIASFGSPEKARDVAREASLNATTLHEMIHLFEPEERNTNLDLL